MPRALCHGDAISAAPGGSGGGGAHKDVVLGRAVHLGELFSQRAALRVGIDVWKGELAERLRDLWRRTVGVLVSVELDDVGGVAAELFGEHLQRIVQSSMVVIGPPAKQRVQHQEAREA